MPIFVGLELVAVIRSILSAGQSSFLAEVTRIATIER